MAARKFFRRFILEGSELSSEWSSEFRSSVLNEAVSAISASRVGWKTLTVSGALGDSWWVAGEGQCRPLGRAEDSTDAWEFRQIPWGSVLCCYGGGDVGRQCSQRKNERGNKEKASRMVGKGQEGLETDCHWLQKKLFSLSILFWHTCGDQDFKRTLFYVDFFLSCLWNKVRVSW